MSVRDLSELSMFELFRLDAEGQIQALTHGLLTLERNSTAAEPLEACMRAAHSLKGAARIVGLDVWRERDACHGGLLRCCATRHDRAVSAGD